jgi:hypothetical protein
MVYLSRADAFALCHTCKLRHPCFSWQGYLDFCQRHEGHSVSYLNRDALHEQHRSPLAAWNPRKMVQSAFGALDAWRLRRAHNELFNVADYAPNADVKQAFQGAQTMTITSLDSLASSATAGWQSDAVTNTTNLYLDDFFQIKLDFANTAPANSKCVFLFAAHSIDGGTTYTNPATGSQGTITLLDITTTAQAMPTLGQMPYTTADEVAESRAFSMAATANGLLPERYAIALINHTGAAVAASGNTVKHNGVYATVI